MFYGQGAGGAPTAQRRARRPGVAVARNRVRGGPAAGVDVREAAVRPMGETPTRYHVSLDVADRPGCSATVAHGVRRARVSIAAVRQEGTAEAASGAARW